MMTDNVNQLALLDNSAKLQTTLARIAWLTLV